MIPTFKVVSADFAVEDRHSGGGGKVVEDAELVSQQAISKRLKQLGMIEKEGYWVPHQELKPRDVERRLFGCEQLLERQA
nr:Mariner Mos1 transposase [Hymenolepis microstoma]CUU00256.1 Mariner Mos1 transposase [Hymenolepis microstoma]